ncbi:S8 family serine peptidase [Sphaerisporangium sp. NPDC051017]|uniref:S8 family peptidase n=1 Tax=Sphaerisporangium sp. NPDC051017 TaxID=3154636 RepID=UPI003435FDAB
MQHALPKRRLAATAVAFAMVGAAFLGGAIDSASAATTEEPTSTPVNVDIPDGMLMSYVVNARIANPGQTRLVERAVEAAGGVVVQSWPEIGVVVAHSDRAAFRANVTAEGGNAVASVGATRTAGVSEGTPADLAPPWGPGASGYKKGAKKPVNGDIPSDPQPGESLDPNEGVQWDMRMIKAPQAQAISDGNRNVLVGVLDSGISPTHPDLKANIDVANSVNCTNVGRPDQTPLAWRPTTSDHGTHVAGTIAAARNNIGIVGVAPSVRMASVKVVNNDGYIYPEYAVCGFMWSGLKHMDVTNNSYYIDPFEFWCDDQPDQAASKEAVRRAVEWATKQGVVHVAAAGNSNYDLANKTVDRGSPNDAPTPTVRTINNHCNDIPAEFDGVVTVASLQRVGTTLDSVRSSFSNYGLGKIDVAAPGSSIYSTTWNTRTGADGYGTKSGTSMASPHVAGVMAQMKSAHPSWSPAKMISELKARAEFKSCPQNTTACTGTVDDNGFFGAGVVDALAVIK